jgi:hypothetical protein
MRLEGRPNNLRIQERMFDVQTRPSSQHTHRLRDHRDNAALMIRWA